MSSSFIYQLTVYADVKVAAQLDLIKSCAERVCPNNTHIVPVASLNSSSPPSRASLQFMQLWERERGDTMRVVRNDVPFLNQFECFITAGQSLASGEVAYALYQRQMPVLALSSSAGEAETGMKGNSVDHASSRRAAPTAVQKFLYRERKPSSSVEEDIKDFFTFPNHMGAMLAVECGGVSAQNFHDVCESLRHLCEPKFHDNHLVFLGSDGYPLTKPPQPSERSDTGSEEHHHRHHHTESAGGTAGGMLPPPVPRFEHLMRTLTRGGEGEEHGDDGFYDLLQQSPQLYGALAAFNRYENKGLLRYLMQRGNWPVVLNHTAPTAAELERVVRAALPSPMPSTESTAGTTTATTTQLAFKAEGQMPAPSAESFRKHLSSLHHFEGHWMDMPLPSHTVCLAMPEAKQADGIGASSPLWLAYMKQSEAKTGGDWCVEGPGGDDWDVLECGASATPQPLAERVSAILCAEVKQGSERAQHMRRRRNKPARLSQWGSGEGRVTDVVKGDVEMRKKTM